MSNSGKATLENSIKGDIDLELIGNSVQLTTTGKNLINNNIYTHGYLASVDTGQKISLNTEAKSFTTSMDVSSMVGENISISVQTKEETGKKYAFTDESDTIISGKWDAGRNTYSKFQNIQVPQNAKKLYFSVTYDVQENTELQVELGAKVTTYEPYTGGKPSPSPEYPQEVKNTGKLNADTKKYEIVMQVKGADTELQSLTLTSDRPITKWDKLVEQGGSMGWLYSGKIAKEFTFVSKASDENISGRIRRRFKTSLNGKFPQTDKVMCNFLTTDNVRNDYSIGIVGSGDIYIYFYENTGVETLEQANHWLKNLPFEKTIIFERKTTEFVPLSESEQTQLRNLHSYNGTTNITVDSGDVPCGIKVVYKQKK